jgi:hexosaminidase
MELCDDACSPGWSGPSRDKASTVDSLLPKPVAVERLDGVFELDHDTTLSGEPSVVRWFRRHVGAATGLRFDPAACGGIEFRIDPSIPGKEAYRLDIRPDRVCARAHDVAGAHYAAQTLRQLLRPEALRSSTVHSGPWSIPCGTVIDHPRFSWRGCHLDVARHFLPTREVLRFIDLLAAHKLNVLHLHLTDDQGWRIEIPRYPKLTSVGGWRHRSMIGRGEIATYDDRPHGGYYTTDDLKEIVAYAAEHYITVIPEIDVPGHCQAAIAAYPELGNDPWSRSEVRDSWGTSDHVLNTEDATVAFFRDVIDHVLEIFPSPAICVGGDAVPGGQWENSEHARRRAAELGLDRPADLHGWFVRQMIEHVGSRGRRAMGWDEILDAGATLPGSTIVASRRGGGGGAHAGHDIVLCPRRHLSFDHRQSDRFDEPIPVGYLCTLADVYRYEPMPEGLAEDAADHVLGAQALVWTEHLDSPRRVDYAVFPRLTAFAEVVWTASEQRDFADFQRRLTDHHLRRLDALGVEYRPLTGPHPWQTRPGVPGRPL